MRHLDARKRHPAARIRIMAEAPVTATATLEAVLAELTPLEPIFHTADFGRTLEDFAARMAPGYWEIGASGKRYSREFLLEHLAANPPIDAAGAGWVCSGHQLLELAPDTFLLTCNLDQCGRLSRRATLWRRSPAGWQILYHQGTLAASL